MVQDLATQWVQSFPCKTKTSQETQKSQRKSWSQQGTTSHLHWQFLRIWQVLWRIILESLYVNTHRSETNGIAQRAVRRIERRHVCSVVAIRSGWEMVDRFHGMLFPSAQHSRSLIWWENSIRKAFWRTCQRINHSVWFIDWVLPYLCERPVKNPSIWKESLTWIVPWIRSVRGVNLEGWHNDCRHLRSWTDGRIWNLLEKAHCKRVDISERKWKIHVSSRRWTNKICRRRSGTENILLDTGPPNSRRRSPWFSWRIRRVSSSTTSRLVSGCWWSDWWFLAHVRKLHIPPSRWTQSQILLAERRIIPYSTEIHWRLQNKHKFGCSARAPHQWLLECRWVKRFVWLLDRFHSVYSVTRETSKRIYVVRMETDKKAADIQVRSFMARALDQNGKECQAEGEAKVVTWKAPSWKRTKIERDLFHCPWGQGIQGDHQEYTWEFGNVSGSCYVLPNLKEQ